MHNLRALKLVALIKFARLKYLLEEHNEQEGPAYVLRTAQGELHYEYEIINYIVF